MPETTGQSAGQSATITVECSCGKRLKAPATAVGRKAKCPKCGNVLVVQAPPPPEPDELGFDDGALYELAANEAQHAATAEASETRCPNCARLMAQGGILCTNCGYDVRKGKIVAQTQIDTGAAAPAQPQKKSMFAAFGGKKSSATSTSSKSNPWKPGAKSDEKAAEPTAGNFIMGLVLGFGFALAAAMVPFFVWWKADFIPFNGWLVLVVGAAAGIGVNMGYKAGTHVAGATAGSITLVIVLLTKLAVMVAYVAPVVKEAVDEAKIVDRDQRVVEMLTFEELKKQKLDPDIATMEQELGARRTARERLEKMSDAEYQKYLGGAPAFEQKKSLIPFVTDQVLKEKNLKPEDASGLERKEATKEARARVEKMSASDREKKLAQMEKEASDEEKAQLEEMRKEQAEAAKEARNSKRHASDNDGDSKSGSGGHSLVGFAIIMVIAFFIWAMIPTFVAMSLAWKIAANA